jgi:hypothetical protein
VLWEPLPKKKPLFVANDVSIGARQCIDSKETLRDLVFWLTVRPGDTNDEFFEEYTDYQRQWAIDHADELIDWRDQEGLEEGEKWCAPFIDIPV